MGIHWCLIADDSTKDGNKKLTEKENNKDSTLFSLLNGSKGKNVNNVKPYFPIKTKYFDVIHEDILSEILYRENAFKKLCKQEIIFFDPDNGLEVSSTNNKNKFKYLSYDILKQFWNNGNSMIVYQHLARDKMYLEDKINKITELLKCHRIGNIKVVRKGNVDYIFIIQKEHYILHDIIADFVGKNGEYKICEI
jgi:hypothetical protein